MGFLLSLHDIYCLITQTYDQGFLFFRTLCFYKLYIDEYGLTSDSIDGTGGAGMLYYTSVLPEN